jgi:lysophospholipase
MTSLLTSLLVFLLTATLAAAANITDYAPTTSVRCPTKCSLLRIFSPPNQTLHAEEIAYVASRGTNESWVAFLGTGADIGYDVRMFESRWSKVGISISGGGYRAALNGAGVLGTLDGREVGVSSAGLGLSGTAGLLQVASYVSGLSGACLLFPCVVGDLLVLLMRISRTRRIVDRWIYDHE